MSGNVTRAKDTEAYITHCVRATLSNLAMVLLVVGNGHHLTFSPGPMAARVPNHGNILLKNVDRRRDIGKHYNNEHYEIL